MKQIKVLVLVGLIFVCYQHVLFSNQSDSGIFMSVSGRIVDTEKNVGIGDMKISIANITYRLGYDTKTDKNGYFIFKEVPDGHYIFDLKELYINLYQKKLNHLIIDSESKEIGFDVTVGKNIINLNINLIRGASISGKIFGPDGKTPIQKAIINIYPYIDGKPPVVTDILGNYKIEGIKANVGDNSSHSNLMGIEAKGYAAIDRGFNIKNNGENISDFNVVLGIGVANLRGRITYKKTGLPVTGMKVTIEDLEETNAIISGETVTDHNGEFSILGFPNIGKAEITVYSSEDSIEDSILAELVIEIKKGENVFNVEIEGIESKKANNFFLNSSKKNGITYDWVCNCNERFYKNDLDAALLESCEKMKQSIACIKSSQILKCMQDNCIKNDVDIFCEECELKYDPETNYTTLIPTCGYYSVNNDNIHICVNAPGGCRTIPLSEILFHEKIHHCDDRVTTSDCREYTAYSAEYCIYKVPWVKEQRRKFNLKCQQGSKK